METLKLRGIDALESFSSFPVTLSLYFRPSPSFDSSHAEPPLLSSEEALDLDRRRLLKKLDVSECVRLTSSGLSQLLECLGPVKKLRLDNCLSLSFSSRNWEGQNKKEEASTGERQERGLVGLEEWKRLSSLKKLLRREQNNDKVAITRPLLSSLESVHASNCPLFDVKTALSVSEEGNEKADSSNVLLRSLSLRGSGSSLDVEELHRGLLSFISSKGSRLKKLRLPPTSDTV